MECSNRRPRKPCNIVKELLNTTAAIMTIVVTVLSFVRFTKTVRVVIEMPAPAAGHFVKYAPVPAATSTETATAIATATATATAVMMATTAATKTRTVSDFTSAVLPTRTKVPPAAAAGEDFFSHTVRADEILACIAEFYCGSQGYFNEICDYSELEDCHQMNIGDEIRIPFSLLVELGDGQYNTVQCEQPFQPVEKISCTE